jgi:hypothetical protein
MSKIEIPAVLWWQLIRQLRFRGRGEHESGAFLLGQVNSRLVSRFICYDDLDQFALCTGIITLHARGFSRLWDLCQKEHVRVLADVHTHPTGWTDQSESDRTHPMVAQIGHVALIVPHFAKGNSYSLRGVGVHEYLGDHRWKKWPLKSSPIQISIL